MTRLLLILVACLSASGAWAKTPFGPYRGHVVRVIDGDTVVMDLETEPGHTWRVHVRVAGVDTPETYRPKCASERAAGKVATRFTNRWLIQGPITVSRIHRGKYAGRVIGAIERNGATLAQALIAAGHGREYHGGHRAGWCQGP